MMTKTARTTILTTAGVGAAALVGAAFAVPANAADRIGDESSTSSTSTSVEAAQGSFKDLVTGGTLILSPDSTAGTVDGPVVEGPVVGDIANGDVLSGNDTPVGSGNDTAVDAPVDAPIGSGNDSSAGTGDVSLGDVGSSVGTSVDDTVGDIGAGVDSVVDGTLGD